jgi:hypothetical protein
MTALVFIHKGDSLVLKVAIAQANLSNPSARVILVGDDTYQMLNSPIKFEYERINDYSVTAKKFESIYKHSSSNPYSYELFCFQRWFILRELAIKCNINSKFVYLDSDALIYADVDHIFPKIKTEMSVCNEVGPAFTFFKSLSVLDDYCEFIYSSFTDPKKYLELENYVTNYNNVGLPHISDMATLGLFGKKTNLNDIGRVTEKNFIFCENIGESQGLVLGMIGKKVIRRKGRKFFRTTNGNLVEAGGVHLQGWQKILWPFYCDKSVLFVFKKEILIDFWKYLRGYFRGVKMQFKKTM